MIGTFLYRLRGNTSVSPFAMACWHPSMIISMAPSGPVHAGTVTVNITRSDLQVGPENITFEIASYSGFDTPAPTGAFDVRFHDFAFLWSFGDPGSQFTVPERLPVPHRNANVAYGPEVAHTYGPGTYTASVLVVEVSSGKTAFWESNPLAVADPNVFFAGKTFTVDPDGTGNYTSFVPAMAAARDATGPWRVSLLRGKSHPMPSRLRFDDVPWDNIYVDAYGSGAKPVITLGTGASNSYLNGVFASLSGMNRDAAPTRRIDFVITDVDFTGLWNPLTETGSEQINLFAGLPASSPPPQGVTDRGPDYTLIHNSAIRGVAISFTGDWEHLAVSNTSITDWQMYGFLVGNCKRVVLLGDKIAQNPLAVSGGDKHFAAGPAFDGLRNDHGPFRTSNADRMIVDGCDFFSCAGWFLNDRHIRSVNPAMRIMQDQVSVPDGSRMNMQRSILEGGASEVLDVQPANTAADRVHNVRIEKCYFFGSHSTAEMIQTHYAGYTVRNCVMVHPNPAQRHPNGSFNPTAFVRVSGSITLRARVLVEHNTMVDLFNGGTAAVPVGVSGVAQPEIVERNNLRHAPNRSPAVTTFAPLDATVQITPYTVGFQKRTELFTGALAANVPNGGTFSVNYSTGEYGNGVQASWFTGTNPDHNIQISGAARSATFSFGATAVTITNTSGVQWNSGQAYSLVLMRAATALPPFRSSWATPLSTGAFYLPLAGSSALGAATGPVIRDDFLGTLRTQTRDLGAFEVA